MLLRELYSAQVSAAQLPWTPLRGRLLLYDRHHTTWAPSSAPRCQLLLVAFHHPTTTIPHQTPQHMLLRELYSAQVSAAQLPWTPLRGRPLLYDRHPTTWAPISAPRCQLLLVAFHHSTPTSQTSAPTPIGAEGADSRAGFCGSASTGASHGASPAVRASSQPLGAEFCAQLSAFAGGSSTTHNNNNP